MPVSSEGIQRTKLGGGIDMEIESHERGSEKKVAPLTGHVEQNAVRFDFPDFQEQLGDQAEKDNLLRPYLPFFLNTWLSHDYAYRIYFTRRCFNLNEILFTLRTLPYSGWGYDEHEFATLMKARATFLSQNALFSYVENITAEYAQRGVFPRILIVDELIIYGRQATAFLKDLESAIIHEWNQKYRERLGGQTERQIRRDFLNAIDVRIYAQDDHAPLEERYFSRIRSEKRMQRSEWREMTLKMAAGLTRSDLVENASYAPFFRLDKEDYVRLKKQLGDDGWNVRHWTYHCLDADIWQNRRIAFMNKVVLQGTLRVHEDACSDTVRIVPLALFEKISAENLKAVSKDLEQFFAEKSPEAFKHIIRLLKSECPILLKVKMQWISFLLSIIMFFDALERAGIMFKLSTVDKYGFSKNRNHDLDKIAKNFGFLDDTFKALYTLCASEKNAQTLRHGLRTMLYTKLKDSLVLLRTPGEVENAPPQSAEKYIRPAEDFFFKAGARDEKYLSIIKTQGLVYSVIVPTNIHSSMSKYLKYFRENTKEFSYALNDCIGILLMMMDVGVTAMTIRDENDEFGEAFLSNWVRAGEQSLYVLARRYYRFFPALVELESRCERIGYNVIRQIRRFGEYLEYREPNQKNLGEHFADDLYRCLRNQGYKLRDWNIDFLLDLDIPVKRGDAEGVDDVRSVRDWDGKPWEEREWERFRRCAGNRRKFQVYERKQQLAYVRMAKDFPL